MKWKHINYEESKDIAIITINNPKKMNSMNMRFLHDMEEVLDICEKNREIRCAILTGAGDKAFTSGGDVKEERDYNSEQIKEYNERGCNLITKIRNSRIPYIAAVNGYALGAGIGLITVCDLVLSSENSVFGLPTIGLGGIPGWGCTQTITKIIGPQRAKMLLLANETYSAEEAKDFGIVNKIVKQEQLIEEAIKYAEKIASFAPNAVELSKYAINNGLDCTFEKGLAIEAEMLNRCNNDYNFKEGITAFLEKRPAIFKTLMNYQN